MDNEIFNNTEKYANASIKYNVQKKVNNNDLEHITEKKIYVYQKPKTDAHSWRAALIDASTQSGKTWKCFEIFNHRKRG